MGYYSIVALARQPVGIPDPVVLLDTGVNVFTAQTDDLERLLEILRNEGVTVQQVNQLDALDQVTMQESLLLPNEREQPELAYGEEETDT